MLLMLRLLLRQIGIYPDMHRICYDENANQAFSSQPTPAQCRDKSPVPLLVNSSTEYSDDSDGSVAQENSALEPGVSNSRPLRRTLRRDKRPEQTVKNKNVLADRINNQPKLRQISACTVQFPFTNDLNSSNRL